MLVGITLSLLITYFLIIRKFFKFINHERDQNDLYRMNANISFEQANVIVDEPDESDKKNEEIITKW